MAEYNFDSFRYWFIPTGKVNEWKVLGADPVAFIHIGDDGISPVVVSEDASKSFDILEDFYKFKERPEFIVGQGCLCTLEDAPHFYQRLLTGTYLLHTFVCCKDIDEMKAKYNAQGSFIEEKLRRLLEWLSQTDFYTAPASTKYHDAIDHGLVVHSLKVYNKVIDLISTETFKDTSVISATLVALTHDWCKTGYYEPYMKNVKDDRTGTWHQEKSYTVNQKGVPLGHGVSSMFLASKFFNLSTEEALAIRWHMGRWNCCEIEMSELQKANETCPLVYLVQFADQLACVKY